MTSVSWSAPKLAKALDLRVVPTRPRIAKNMISAWALALVQPSDKKKVKRRLHGPRGQASHMGSNGGRFLCHTLVRL